MNPITSGFLTVIGILVALYVLNMIKPFDGTDTGDQDGDGHGDGDGHIGDHDKGDGTGEDLLHPNPDPSGLTDGTGGGHFGTEDSPTGAHFGTDATAEDGTYG